MQHLVMGLQPRQLNIRFGKKISSRCSVSPIDSAGRSPTARAASWSLLLEIRTLNSFQDGRLKRVKGKVTTVTNRRKVEPLYRPRWKRYLVGAAHVAGLSLLLAAGTVWTLNQQHPHFTSPA